MKFTDRLVSITLWVLGLVFLLVPLVAFQPIALSTYDESLIVTGALQWLSGLRTGIDFYTTYGPLQFFLAAQVLDAFNGNLLATRALHALILGLAIMFVANGLYKATKKRSIIPAILFSLLAVMVLSFFSAPLYPNHSLLLPFSFIFMLKVRSSGTRHSILEIILLSGAVCCAGLFRPDLGLLLCAGLILSTPFEVINYTGTASPSSFPDRLKNNLLISGLGILATMMVDRMTDGSVSGVLGLIKSVHSVTYADFRSLPFPTLQTIFAGEHRQIDVIAAYLPLSAVMLAGLIYLTSLIDSIKQNGKTDNTELGTLYWLCFFTTLLYSLGLVRTDATHLTPSVFFSIAVYTYLYVMLFNRLKEKPESDFPRISGNLDRLRDGVAGAALTAALGFCIYSFVVPATSFRTTLANSCERASLYRKSLGCLQLNPHQGAAVAWLDTLLQPGEKIFSANSRHDRIFVNNMSYYALTGHLPLTYWAHMDPGVQTTKSIQRQIIQDIDSNNRANGRSVIVIEKSPIRQEPNQSAYSSGVHELDQYLSNCTPIQNSNTVRIVECVTDDSKSLASDTLDQD